MTFKDVKAYRIAATWLAPMISWVKILQHFAANMVFSFVVLFGLWGVGCQCSQRGVNPSWFGLEAQLQGLRRSSSGYFYGSILVCNSCFGMRQNSRNRQFWSFPIPRPQLVAALLFRNMFNPFHPTFCQPHWGLLAGPNRWADGGADTCKGPKRGSNKVASQQSQHYLQSDGTKFGPSQSRTLRALWGRHCGLSSALQWDFAERIRSASPCYTSTMCRRVGTMCTGTKPKLPKGIWISEKVPARQVHSLEWHGWMQLPWLEHVAADWLMEVSAKTAATASYGTRAEYKNNMSIENMIGFLNNPVPMKSVNKSIMNFTTTIAIILTRTTI